MTNNMHPITVLSTLQSILSPSTLAAMRNVLTALAAFVGVLGVAGLTQTNLQHLVDSLMGIGTALMVLVTALGGFVAAASTTYAAYKSTSAQQAKSVAATITAESGMPVEDQPTMITVSNAMGDRPDVKVIELHDKVLAAATSSDKVVGASSKR